MVYSTTPSYPRYRDDSAELSTSPDGMTQQNVPLIQ